jgi:hypothetical protein
MKNLFKVSRKNRFSLRKWIHDKASIALITAMCVPVLVGFSGLSLDIGYWYTQKTTLYGLASVSSMAAARAELYGLSSVQDIQPVVEHEAIDSWNFSKVPNITLQSIQNGSTVELQWSVPFFLSAVDGIDHEIDENIVSSSKIYLDQNGNKIIALSQ